MKRTPRWHERAQKLRADGLTYDEIADEVNRSVTGVYNICKDIDCPVENRGRSEDNSWYETAIKLRTGGDTLQSIADEFDVTRERIRQITIDVECPVENRGGDRRSDEYRNR